MIIWTPAVLSVLYTCVLYFCICTCSAQLSMFHMERRSRNTLIINIIILFFPLPGRTVESIDLKTGKRELKQRIKTYLPISICTSSLPGLIRASSIMSFLFVMPGHSHYKHGTSIQSTIIQSLQTLYFQHSHYKHGTSI